MEEKWFYLDDSKPADERRQGPYPKYMIEHLAQAGVVTPQTLVWHEGLAQWTPWQDLAPPPPPPEPVTPLAPETVASAPIAPKPELVAIYAPFGIRLAATLVDLLFIGMVNALLLLIYTMVFRIPEEVLKDSTIIHLPSLLLDASYQIWFMWQYGGTPGKMLVGLKIVTDTGKPMTLGRSFGRYLAFWMSALSLGIGFIMIVFDPMRRALHDRLAGTRVIVHQYEVSHDQSTES